MKIKEQAYQLFNLGYSYSEIALELSISKSTSHSHVKKMKIKESVVKNFIIQCL